jgi:hypothetical protein
MVSTSGSSGMRQDRRSAYQRVEAKRIGDVS